MKVSDVVAESSTVEVMLEPEHPEHPAEIALVNLMGQCKAECIVMQKPSEQVPGTKDQAEPNPPKLRITVQIKGGGVRGY